MACSQQCMPEAHVTGVPPSVAAGVAKSGTDPASAIPDSSDSGGSRSRRHNGTVYVSLVLVAASIVACFLLRGALRSDPGHAENETTLNLDTFVVNLEGGNQRAYLRVGIALTLSQPPTRKDAVPVAPLRDAIVTVLSSAQPEQLLTSEGKQKIKKELLIALQERAPALGIENVYFTEFLVQM